MLLPCVVFLVENPAITNEKKKPSGCMWRTMLPIPEKVKEYSHQFPGQVVSVTDPENRMRVQVRVMPMFENVDQDKLPWAEYCLSPGFRAGEGVFIPVKVDDWVWVDFPFKGDTRRPRIIGGIHQAPGGMPAFPGDARGESYSHQRTGDEPAPTPPAYHDGSIVVDQNGALLEIAVDSAIRVTHKASASAIEITKDGHITFHGEGQINVSAADNVKMICSANLNIEATGPVDVQAQSTVNVECEEAATVTSQAKVTVKGMAGVDIDGGPAGPQGVVQGSCICPLTGAPHVMRSATVKASL